MSMQYIEISFCKRFYIYETLEEKTCDKNNLRAYSAWISAAC